MSQFQPPPFQPPQQPPQYQQQPHTGYPQWQQPPQQSWYPPPPQMYEYPQQQPSDQPRPPAPQARQRPPQQRPSVKRRTSSNTRLVIVVLIMIISAISYGVQQSHFNISAPSSTTPQTFSGNGAEKTQTFSVANQWTLTWSRDPSSFFDGSYNVIISIYKSDGTPLDYAAVNTICSVSNTGGSTQEYGGGSVYLDINSEAAWTIKIS